MYVIQLGCNYDTIKEKTKQQQKKSQMNDIVDDNAIVGLWWYVK